MCEKLSPEGDSQRWNCGERLKINSSSFHSIVWHVRALELDTLVGLGWWGGTVQLQWSVKTGRLDLYVLFFSATFLKTIYVPN